MNHYPRLSWDHPYGGGNGTITNPYQIWTSEQMIALETDINNWDNYFILMADLDLSGLEFIPIANWITPFTGTFDGNGHILRNIVINRPDMDFVGLFSYLDFGGEIKNLGIENININGRYLEFKIRSSLTI